MEDREITFRIGMVFNMTRQWKEVTAPDIYQALDKGEELLATLADPKYPSRIVSVQEKD